MFTYLNETGALFVTRDAAHYIKIIVVCFDKALESRYYDDELSTGPKRQVQKRRLASYVA